MIEVYLALQAALIVLGLWGVVTISRYLRAHPAVADEAALEAFKRLARANMYAALVYLVLGVVSIGMGVWVMVDHGLKGVLIVIAAHLPAHFISRRNLKLENAAREAECATEELLKAHRHIGMVWRKKALPDF